MLVKVFLERRDDIYEPCFLSRNGTDNVQSEFLADPRRVSEELLKKRNIIKKQKEDKPFKYTSSRKCCFDFNKSGEQSVDITYK